MYYIYSIYNVSTELPMNFGYIEKPMFTLMPGQYAKILGQTDDEQEAKELVEKHTTHFRLNELSRRIHNILDKHGRNSSPVLDLLNLFEQAYIGLLWEGETDHEYADLETMEGE